MTPDIKRFIDILLRVAKQLIGLLEQWKKEDNA